MSEDDIETAEAPPEAYALPASERHTDWVMLDGGPREGSPVHITMAVVLNGRPLIGRRLDQPVTVTAPVEMSERSMGPSTVIVVPHPAATLVCLVVHAEHLAFGWHGDDGTVFVDAINDQPVLTPIGDGDALPVEGWEVVDDLDDNGPWVRLWVQPRTVTFGYTERKDAGD